MELFIAICDDSENDRQYEKVLIEQVLNELKHSYTIYCFSSPEELLKSSHDFNIIFLDVEMDGMNGIQTARKVRDLNKNCLIFFVTNYASYLDDAFDQRAFRFWTKPLDKHRLTYGIKSALKELNAMEQYITVSVNAQKIKIPINRIIYIYTRDKRIYIVTVKGELSVSETYKEICDALKAYKNFCEIYRGITINFKYVTDYTKDKVYCSYKEQRYELYISRRKSKNFVKEFFRYMGEE